MLLKELLPSYKGKFENIDVTGITSDSRKVNKGNVFVCINGPLADGHNFYNSALSNGASVIVSEKDLKIDNQIIVEDTHETFGYMCAKWFDFPANRLKIIGVTGTNGKTSVSYMIKKILEKAGQKVGLIGTIQNMIGQKTIETGNTTPGIYDLNRLFKEMADDGCSYAVMEVSSHALHQRRVCGFTFETAIFTNLTQDHLDYHGTMENYLNAKKILFTMCKTAVINQDDKYYNELVKDLNCKIVTYSLNNGADFCAKNVDYRPDGVDYKLFGNDKISHIKLNTGGKFSVYNSLAASACTVELGIDEETVCAALLELKGIKGRAEVVPCDLGFTVIIDYAHTPDGLKNILSTFKECKKNRLTVLFGCGGDRDKTKRSIMGSVAVHNADCVIVTSDNPRSEEPSSIINDILEGTKGMNTPVKVIENRIDAIRFALNNAAKDDIIVLAGKGHETYQILKDKTIHLDEREIVEETVKEIKEKRSV